MGVETREVEIDGVRFSVTQLGARAAMRLLPRIGRIVGPAIADATNAIPGGNLGEADVAKLGGALGTLFDRLTPEEQDALLETLLQGARVQVEGKWAPLMESFDFLMAGKALTVYRLLWFALGVNYGDFTGALRGLAARGKTMASASPA